METTVLASIAVAISFLAVVPAEAKQPRSSVERHAFVKEVACPATGRHRLPCPEYHIDHIKPLCAGGADHRSNMQWLSIPGHKIKTRQDVAGCRIIRSTPTP